MAHQSVLLVERWRRRGVCDLPADPRRRVRALRRDHDELVLLRKRLRGAHGTEQNVPIKSSQRTFDGSQRGSPRQLCATLLSRWHAGNPSARQCAQHNHGVAKQAAACVYAPPSSGRAPCFHCRPGHGRRPRPAAPRSCSRTAGNTCRSARPPGCPASAGTAAPPAGVAHRRFSTTP